MISSEIETFDLIQAYYTSGLIERSNDAFHFHLLNESINHPPSETIHMETMTLNRERKVGQKYQLNDRVRKTTVHKSASLPPRVGVILGVEVKKDKKRRPSYYYMVQWDDLKSPSLHAQQVLTLE